MSPSFAIKIRFLRFTLQEALLPEAVMPVFAADKHEALKAGNKLAPGDMNNYFTSRLMGYQLFIS